MLLGAFEFLNIFDGCEIKKITSIIFSKMFKKGESDLLVDMNGHQFEDLRWVKCNLVLFPYLIYSIKLSALSLI